MNFARQITSIGRSQRAIVSLLLLFALSPPNASAGSLNPTKFNVGIWGVSDTSGLNDVKGKFDFIVNQSYRDLNTANPFLSACAARGLPCILTLDYIRADPKRSTYEPNYTTNLINGIKGNAGFGGVLLVDEPYYNKDTNMSVSSCEEIYRKIKSVDSNPFHPVFVDAFTNNDDPVSEVDAYKKCYDIFLSDNYPFQVKEGNSFTEYFMYNAAYFKSHAAPKSWWNIVQMADANYNGSTLFIVPGIPNEQRMITYIPLIFGAKTVVFYTYPGLLYKDIWTFVKRLAQELRQQRAVWNQPVLSTPAVSVSGSSYIKTGLRRWNGDYYLIAANWYDGGNLATPVYVAQNNVQITIGGVSNAAVMTIGTSGKGSAAGGRCLGTTNSSGTFKDNFDPYAVHVYKIVPGTSKCTGELNLIKNSSFASLTKNSWASNWARNDTTSVLIKKTNSGAVSTMRNRLALLGGLALAVAQPDRITVDATSEYLLRIQMDVQGFVSGGYSVLADEFDKTGKYVSRQRLGGNNANFVGYRYYHYKPSSPGVKIVQIKIYTEHNSHLTLYVDSVELRKVIQ